MGNTASGKLIKEVAADARAILSASSKDTYKQVVARRVDMEKQLLEVTKHKEELLKRRAAGVKAIVANYEAKRSQMLEDFANRQVPSSMGNMAAGSGGDGLDGQDTGKGAATRLPSPEEILQRMRNESSREASSSSSSRETPPP